MNVFDLEAKIGLDSSEYENGLEDASTKTHSFSNKLKSGLGVAAKVTGAALTAAGAAVGALAKQSIEAYADFEQLEGGIETLFGDSAAKVMADASEAFKTAGMSMNEYMDTSIQSAAALINSLGGDQAKAAEYMNMSITDMADNVNKMGTSMEGVQNAYRGFSRGNFTMLDNLALGFTGTKEGMQELLDKAEELSGVKYDINSYADIVEAIHVVQDEMGITGTTAREASETISGSVSSMKSAWKNLITGIADDNADFDTLITNFVDSVGTVADNLIPRIETALGGIAELVEKLAPMIAEKLPGLIDKILPGLLSAATSLLEALVTALPTLLQVLVAQLPTIINTIVQALLSAIPQLIDVGVTAIVTLATGIAEALPELIPAVIEAIFTICDALLDNLDLLIDAVIQLMIGITEGIINALPILIEKIPEIIEKLVEAIIENAPLILQAVWDCLVMIGETLWSYLGPLLSQVGEWFSSLLQSIGEWLSQLPDKIGYWIGYAIGTAVAFLAELPGKVKEKFDEVIQKVKEWGPEFVKTAKENAKQFKDDLIEGLKELPEKIKEIGRNIVEGLKNGIKEKWEDMKNWFKNLGQGLIDGFSDKFEVKSPSRVFKRIGGYVAEGFGIGFDDEWVNVQKEIGDVSLDMQFRSPVAQVSSSVYGKDKTDVVVNNTIKMEPKISALFDAFVEENNKRYKLTRKDAFVHA